MDDDAIRGFTVIKAGEITWPAPPSKPPAAPAAKPAAATPPPRKKKASAEGGGIVRIDDSGDVGIGAAVPAGRRLYAPAAFLGHFTVFVLARLVGYMVVWNVTPALHTPLMSVTNAISSIICIGALVQIAPPSPESAPALSSAFSPSSASR